MFFKKLFDCVSLALLILLQLFGSIMPKTTFFLPLFFRNNRFFLSKRITILSFLIIGIIYWNVYQVYQNIGDILLIKDEITKFKTN